MQVPLDPEIKTLTDIPYTISYIIKKRQFIDNLNELPKDKRPPESLIWEGTPEELEGWLDKVFDRKNKEETELIILESEIE